MRGASGHAARIDAASAESPDANQAHLCIAHHADEFRGSLPSVQRHDNDAIGHECEVESDPVN